MLTTSVVHGFLCTEVDGTIINMELSPLSTLESLCLNTIVDNLDRFNYAFNASENSILKRNFEFLQRVYSDTLVALVSDKLDLKEEYFNLVLNKFITVLELDFPNCRWESIIQKITEIGGGLERLNVSTSCGDSIASSPDTFISHIPNIKILHLYSVCTDNILKSISKHCPFLTELYISECSEVSDEGLLNLCHKDENGKVANSVLRILDLEGTQVKNSTIAFLLENIPTLEVIDYEFLPTVLYDMHKKDLQEGTLSKIKPYNLTKLDVLYLDDRPLFSDVLLICSTLCPNLKTLCIPVKEKQHLDLCSKFSKLESISIGNSRADNDMVIDGFLKQKGSNLRILKLYHLKLSISVVAQSCPHLENLWLKDVNFLEENFTIIPFTKLLEFTFENASFMDVPTSAAVKWIITSSPKLEYLGLVNCDPFPPDIKVEILNCCTHCILKHINFQSSDVDLELLKSIIRTCTSLESLCVESCDLTTDDIDLLTEIAVDNKNNLEIISSEDGASDFDFFDLQEEYDLYDSDYDDYDDYFHDYYDDGDDDEDI